MFIRLPTGIIDDITIVRRSGVKGCQFLLKFLSDENLKGLFTRCSCWWGSATLSALIF